jgi:hypothetical protein
MMAAKLRTGAFGASGQPLPDKETQDALLSALTAESAGATAWTINREKDSVISASIVEQLPSTDKEAHGEPDLYRLSITCNTFTRKGEMLLAWSPGVPKDGRIMSAAVDGKPPVTYKVEGTETMGNGQKGSSGPGAILLDATALPDQTLTISNAFPDETVVFPIGKLDQEIRHSLAACFMLRIVP